MFGRVEVRITVLGVAKFIPSMKLTRYRWDECRCSGYHRCRCGYGCGNRGISLGVGGISVRVSSLWGVSIVDRGSYTSIIPGDSIMVRSHNGGLGFFRVTNCQNGGENEQRLHGAICRDAKRQETPM